MFCAVAKHIRLPSAAGALAPVASCLGNGLPNPPGLGLASRTPMANITVPEGEARRVTGTRIPVRKAGRLRVGDGELYYREAGSGPPLLLIHGIACNADAFEAVFSSLTARWRVIAYDRRGCSRSVGKPAAPKGYFARQAADAKALLDALGAAPASVLGWSTGGIVALTLAVEHPDEVSRLVLYEPNLHLKKQMTLTLATLFAKTLGLAAIGRKRAAMTTFFRAVLAQSNGPNPFDALDEPTREAILANTEAFFAELRAGTGEELTDERLRTIGCPVTAIVGGRSAPFLGAASARLEKRLPQMRVLRAPGGNHMMPLEKPAEFVRLLGEALTMEDGVNEAAGR
jgi:pimeloyl-ACP methyl ester carboxylesterase